MDICGKSNERTLSARESHYSLALKNHKHSSGYRPNKSTHLLRVALHVGAVLGAHATRASFARNVIVDAPRARTRHGALCLRCPAPHARRNAYAIVGKFLTATDCTAFAVLKTAWIKHKKTEEQVGDRYIER